MLDPIKKIILFLLYFATGLTRKLTSQQKFFALGWRFIFSIILITYFVTGWQPFDIIKQKIQALNGRTDTIRIYANAIEGESEDYFSGWHKLENIKNSADLNPEAIASEFNLFNSALYNGGQEEIVLSNFKLPQPKEDIKEISTAKKEENIFEEILNFESASTTEMATSTSQRLIIDDIINSFQSTSTINIIKTSTSSEQNASSTVEDENSIGSNTNIIEINIPSNREIEIIDPVASNTVEVIEVENEGVEVIIEGEENSSTSTEVISKKEKWFEPRQANAQAESETSKHPGQFKNASIGMSIAFLEINMIISPPEEASSTEDLEIESPTDNTLGSSSEEIISENNSSSPGEIIIEEVVTSTETVVEIIEVEDDSTSTTISLKDFFNIKTAHAQAEPKLIIWYSLLNENNASTAEAELWQKAVELNLETIENYKSDGYLKIPADFINSWEEIERIAIKIEGVVDQDESFVAYLDSLWIEAIYERDEAIVKEQSARWDEALELLSQRTIFRFDEDSQLRFRYNKNDERIWDTLSEMLGWGDFWQDVYMEISLTDNHGEEVDFPISMVMDDDGEFMISIAANNRTLLPGRYTIHFKIEDYSGSEPEVFYLTQDFNWGVLAINFDQAAYTSGEEVYVQMATLDELGHTICNAELELTIISPKGFITPLRTTDKTIIYNPNCGPNNVVDTPDYYAHYLPKDIGVYDVELRAEIKNGSYIISDSFTITESLPFVIERTGPTRIYPWSDYEMNIILTANEEFSGAITEKIPNRFRVVSQELTINGQDDKKIEKMVDDLASTTKQVTSSTVLRKDESTIIYEQLNSIEEKTMIWKNIELSDGDQINIIYTFDAPNISPEFYLLGPLSLVTSYGSDQANSQFVEERAWQIASDAQTTFVVAESISIDTGTTSTTFWEDLVTIDSSSFTGGDTYFIYVTTGFAGSAIGVSTDFEILYNSTPQYTGYVEAPGDAYDAYQVSWFDVYTMPATPEDVILQYRTNSGASYALNAQIIAINLSEIGTSNYAYNENTTDYTHTTVMSPRASVTLSQADGAKDWLVFGMEEVQVNATGRNWEGEIYNGATSYMLHSREGENGAELIPYVIFTPFSDVALNTTFSMRVRDDQQGIHLHDTSRVFALNLDVFENFKTTYQDVNSAIINSPSWTAVGNLNSGGNYTPSTTGDQLIFASFINDAGSASDGSNDRLQVNSVTQPSGWSWVQSPVGNRTTYDASDQVVQNIVSMVSIPDTGQSINMDAIEIVGTGQVIDEYSMTVFSKKLKSINPPTGIFNSAAQRLDGSGVVDISVDINDGDQDDIRAKLEYILGADCSALPGDPTIDSNPANVSATYGLPVIDNDFPYQIGTSGNMILTDTATNTVQFDWLSATNLPSGDAIYCLRLTANDTIYDQSPVATTTLVVDNVDPTVPGPLTYVARTGTTTTLSLNSTSTETNFLEYIIYYKEYNGTDPNESDYKWASTSDANLYNINYNFATETKIIGLTASTTYSFAIWVYDQFGHEASSSRIEVTTNDAPTGKINSVGQKNDGSGIVDIEIEVDDDNNHDTCRAKIEYVAGGACDFSSPDDPTLDENPASISADFGNPVVDNDQSYQVGSSTGWILTSPGSNSVQFDWLTTFNEPAADGTYCLRLTVFDRFDNQKTPTTTTLILDNVDPVSTGSLTAGEVTTDSITLIYATNTPATDTNEPTIDAYRVFYKQGTSGVTEGDTENDDPALNSYDYGIATSTIVGSLDANTWYVFNIWTYDDFGNKASATEIAIKTNTSLSNDSLTFVNPLTKSGVNNIALAGTTTEWIFRAVISETNGYFAIASTTLRLANETDDNSPFDDLEFYWNQTTDSFFEIGTDSLNAVTLSNNSTSTCAVNTCTLDFNLLFNKTFASSSWDYSAEVYSRSDSGTTDFDTYPNIYQVRFPYIAQIHYRWRNDDGGE